MLWIGTDGAGMIQFDGVKFTEVDAKFENRTFHVSDIYFEDQTTYFCTLYEGVYSYKNGKTNFIFKSNGEAEFKYINKIGDRIVVATNYSIYLLSEKGELIQKFILPQIQKTFVSNVVKIPNGVVIFSNVGTYIAQKNGIQSLQNWSKNKLPENYQLGSYGSNCLTLYSNFLRQKSLVYFNNFGHILSIKTDYTGIELKEHLAIKKMASNGKTIFFSLDNDHLYKLENNKLTYIINNSGQDISSIKGLHVDAYGDCWINNISGLYKVSIEPFTKISLSPIYNDGGIIVVYKTASGEMVLGTIAKKTYVGHVYGKFAFQTYPFYTSQVIECPLGTLLATDRGIYELKNNQLTILNIPETKGKRINFIHYDGDNLWFAVAGEHLSKYDVKTKKSKNYRKEIPQFPGYFYTAQNNFNQKVIYFGSNNGIYSYDKSSDQFKLIRQFWKFGAFCGNSCKDIYGTSWFTLDKAIVGITKEGNFTYIADQKKLPSTLFYTLTTDKYGNLMAGTNKGINVIKVDAFGHIQRQKNYGFKEGFGGYETNMRASYQNGNFGFVGTIEGLYMINSDALEHYPAPPAPLVSFKEENDKYILSFKSILGKSNQPEYSYRIIGYNENWSNFSSKNTFYFPELNNGNYIVEVRSTYDRKHFSPVTKRVVKIDLPIYKTKWFIVVVIIFLGIINVGLLEWSKSYVRAEFNETRDMAIDIRTIPRLIFYAIVINILVPTTVNFVQDEIKIEWWFMLVTNSILFLLYFISRFVQKRSDLVDNSLKVIFATYIVYSISSFYLIYETNIHPYPVIQLVIITGLMPFLTSSVRAVLVIVVAQILLSSIFLVWLNDTLYNEILFMLAVVISGALAIMFSYIRLDSLDKLIFVNNLVNRGNVISIAFDESTTIIYTSSNISDIFQIRNEALVGRNMSELNQFVMSQEIAEEKIDEIFEDGKLVLVPMRNKEDELVWIEWTCKQFSEKVRVMMGQDVTEKLTLSTNYKTLVENAQDLIYNTDVNGNFIFANEQSLKIFGYRKEAIIDKSALFLVRSDYREKVLEFYSNQFQNRIQHTYFEFPIKSRDGKIVWIGQNVTMSFEPGSRKRISGFIALARDITEKRLNDLLLEQQNKDITESINAAKRIQFNLLPNKAVFNEHFDEHFLIYQPKEIVSGDFYWIHHVNGKTIVALADCTGHGIAGAFITVMGINLLKQVVLERQITTPKAIIEELVGELNRSLGKAMDSDLTDELSIAIITIEKEQALAASTGVNIIYQQNSQLELTRHSMNEKRTSVNEMTFDWKEENTFYLLTDGMAKQLGSIKEKKFGTRRIIELLQSIQNDSLPLQRKHFENTIRNWSETHEQSDDISILGFRKKQS